MNLVETQAERSYKHQIFFVTPPQKELASRLINQSVVLGVNSIDKIRIEVADEVRMPSTHLDLSPLILRDLRTELRYKILEANNVKIPSFGQVQREVFNRGDTFRWVVWKDYSGSVRASGELSYFEDSSVLQKLYKLGEENKRGWSEMICYNLGIPEITLDQSSKYYKGIIQKQTASFLFPDEIETLRNEGQLVSDFKVEILGGWFEGFLIDKINEKNQSLLFKVRANFTD
ncbi:MAG TPA: hypothetical protein VIK81_05120 [Patescibacteria group bacterium]